MMLKNASNPSRFVRPGEPRSLDMSRRAFIVAAGAAGATFAYSSKLAGQTAGDAATSYSPTIWYEIFPDNRVSVNVIRAEMGQHVGTAIARIVADELGADWDDVEINHVDTDPKWGFMVTGGSWSIWQSYFPMSRAGAAGRIALIDAGAVMLGVSPEQCTAESGRVIAGDRSVTFGEIVSRGNISRTFTPEEVEALPIRPASEKTIVGSRGKANDIPAKVDGSGVYGIDAEIDGMVYGCPAMPPSRYGSTVVSVDETAAKDIPGYVQAVTLTDPTHNVDGWVVAVAETFWAAQKAAKALNVEWKAGARASVSEDELQRAARDLIADPESGSHVRDDAGAVDALNAAESEDVLDAEYTTSTVLHFQLEPVNAIAYQEEDGHWEIHTGNQWQSLTLPLLANALETTEENITMRTYLLGGGFGRRLNGDYAIPAALTSRAIGRPVKLVCTREADILFDCPRSPSVQRMRAALDRSAGTVRAMEHAASAGWPTATLAPPFMPKGVNGVPYDLFALHGADHWYSNLGAHRLRAIQNTLANETFLPGWLRAVGSGWVNWALESFIDEIAHTLGKDPLDFRIAGLTPTGRNAGEEPFSVGGASRQAAVLQRLKEKVDYSAPLPENTGFGVATSFGQEREMPTWSACAAQVRVDPETGRVKCEKLTYVIDCGIPVHPDGALAQAEGAALWGVSMALHEATAFEQGKVKDLNLNTYTPLRMADVPELDIEIVDSEHAPVGMGEPPTTVVAPAIGNAIFNAVGVRMRHLPITPDAVLAALEQKA